MYWLKKFLKMGLKKNHIGPFKSNKTVTAEGMCQKVVTGIIYLSCRGRRRTAHSAVPCERGQTLSQCICHSEINTQFFHQRSHSPNKGSTKKWKTSTKKENYLSKISVKSSGFYSTPNLEEKGSGYFSIWPFLPASTLPQKLVFR